ncbi:Ribosome maturation factor RimM [Alphaproteobacteria bacterium]
MLDYDVVIGSITSTVGVKGYVKIRCFTKSPRDIESFAHVFDKNGNSYRIKVISIKKQDVVALIENVNSRQEAEVLRNVHLMIKRSALPSIGDDEFYYADLFGMVVHVSNTMQKIGVVRQVANFGASDILEIYNKYTEKTIYYPFTKNFIQDVNMRQRYIIVSPIEEIITE